MNSKYQNQFRFFSYLFLVTLILLISANFSFVQGCDMGSSYSLTEMWVEQEDLHSYNHASAITEPIIIANGVVENDYNTCGHEYFTTTTMTLPDNSTVEGAQTNIIIDGIYFSSTQLKYYCPIAAREYSGGESFNQIDYTGSSNEIYYKYTSETIYNLGLKYCNYRACIDTNQNPENGCWSQAYVTYRDIMNIGAVCFPGVRNTYQVYTIPYVGFSYCSRRYHTDLTFNPCEFGTL